MAKYRQSLAEGCSAELFAEWLDRNVGIADPLATAGLKDCILLFILFTKKQHPTFIIWLEILLRQSNSWGGTTTTKAKDWTTALLLGLIYAGLYQDRLV